MEKELLRDTFSLVGTSLQLLESKNDLVVDGVNILGRVAGPSFIVDGKSDNNRYYSRALWEKAIERAQKSMTDGLMLGTIGHDQKLDEKALREGQASHRVSKLWIDKKGIGMAEYLILNTPAGRNLNGYLRGGVKIPVSTRAYGEYKGKVNGVPKIDEETYELEGIDFVRLQGVPGAVPTLLESNGDLDETEETTEEDFLMDKKILEELTTEKVQLQTDLADALSKNEDLKAELAVQKNKLSELTTTSKDESVKLKETSEEVAKLAKLVEGYKELGTPEEVNEVLDKFEAMSKELEGLGSTKEIDEALTKAKELLEEYSPFGTPEEIEKAFDRTEEYVNEVQELGTVQELGLVMNKLEEYIELGTPAEIEKVFEAMEGMITKVQEDHKKRDIKEVASSLKIQETTASKLLEKMDKDEALSVAGTLREDYQSNIGARYKLDEKREEGEEIKPGESKVLSGTRAERITENMK